eukprot:GEZU01016316.1.p1 GENE.GEZU01016316.1~~GEZU01016316.1.p1  ORF type:complete len:145 (+),score=22.04 GEZU01016316.1:200-634(+)
MELLKNSMRAVFERHYDHAVKRLEIDDELMPAITMHFSQCGPELSLRISDAGGGILQSGRSRMFRYFFTTVPQSEPTYTYSGLFGSPMSGLGCGLPMARLYARYMGGDIRVESLVGHGTDVFVYLDRRGTASDDAATALRARLC